MKTKSGTKQKNTTDKQSSSTPLWKDGVFQELADNISDGVYCINTDGYFTFVNRAITERAGLPPDRFHKSHFLDIVHPSYRDQARNNFQRVMKGENGIPYELKYEDANGQVRTVEVHSRPLREGGKIVGVLGISRDLTDRKHKEDVLRESEAKFRTLFESANDAIFLMDQYIFIDCNQKTLEMFGCTREQIIGQSPYRFSPEVQPDGRSSMESAQEKIEMALSGQMQFFEWRHKRYNGTLFDAEVSLNAFTTAGKYYLQAIVRDITDRKGAEEALRESEEKYHSLVSSVDLMYLVDKECRYLFLNEGHRLRFGLRLEEIIGRRYADFHSEEDSTEFAEIVKNVIETGKTIHQEHWSERDGRSFLRTFNPSMERGPSGEITEVVIVSKDVTERKLAEEALQESEAKFRALAESSSAAIFLIQETKYIYINPAFEAITSYTMNDLAGMNFWDFIHPDFRELVKDRGLGRLRGEGPPSRYEIKFVTKSGHERWVDFSATIIEMENRPTIMGWTFDITERKQAEEALQDSKEQYRFVVENLKEVVFRTDAEGHWTFLNSAWAEVTGFAVEESLGKVFLEYVYPEDRQLNLDLFRPLIERKKDYCRHEIRYMNKDGGFRWIEVWARLTLDEKGNATGTAGTLTDITERKLAEETLRKSEEKYRTILENIEEGYHEVDIKGNFTFFNESMRKILGYEREGLVGMNNRQYMDEENSRKVYQTYNRVYRTGEPVKNFECQIIRKDGTRRDVEISISLIRNAEGHANGFRGIVRDTTDLKQAEEERNMLQERLQRAEKMETLGTMAGGVAHDLNNVLGVVIGYSEMLLNSVDESSTIRPRLMNIMKGGEKAAAIVQDLLTMTRRGVSGREVLNLNKIIADCQKSPEFEKLSSYHSTVRIKTDLEPDLLNISGSSVHLGKTLFNLVSNASEAMPKGGILTIKTANQYLDKPIQGYDEVREGDHVVLSVSDTGEGISAADLKRIFEPFYTKKVMGRSGTGLGLAVVWGTVKDHNGYIDVQSEEGKGSTFTLYFPASRQDISAEAAAISISEYMGKGESILIVDDVKEQRDLAAEMLRKLNYNVTSVSSGEEAVAYLKEHKIDLMVLDMIMDPGMDGLDTYRSVLAIHPKQQAIIVSGFSETDRVVIAQALGAGTYVRKPYILEKLGLAVRKELDRTIPDNGM